MIHEYYAALSTVGLHVGLHKTSRLSKHWLTSNISAWLLQYKADSTVTRIDELRTMPCNCSTPGHRSQSELIIVPAYTVTPLTPWLHTIDNR